MSSFSVQSSNGQHVWSNICPVLIASLASGGTSLPTSPAPMEEWMDVEACRPMQFQQPSQGVRKRNARIDIPPERSLQNIDQLISESTNDDEIRDLRKQRRLLKNRKAAYDC
jgi:hypothetical protein